MKPARQPAPPTTLVSWWMAPDIPRNGFTAHAEKEEQARMSASLLGKGRGRVVTTVEDGR